MPSGDDDSRESSAEHQHRVERAGAPIAEAHRQGPFADLGVTRPITKVVHHQQRAGESPHPASGDEADHRHRPDRDERRAEHRHQAEEHEDEDLPEPEIAVGNRAARVPPSGSHAHRPDQHQPPTHRHGEHEPGHPREPEGDQRRPLDPARGHPRRHETDRTDPIIIGAANPVAVVVREVHRHLQGEAHHQGEHHGGEREAVARIRHPGGRRPDGDRDHRGGQRPGTRPEDPESPAGRKIALGRRSRCGVAHVRP